MENKDSLEELFRSIEKNRPKNSAPKAEDQGERRPQNAAANQELSRNKAEKMAQIRAALNQNDTPAEPPAKPAAPAPRPVSAEEKRPQSSAAMPAPQKPVRKTAEEEAPRRQESEKPSRPVKEHPEQRTGKSSGSGKSSGKSGTKSGTKSGKGKKGSSGKKSGSHKSKPAFGPPALAEHGISYGMLVGAIGAGLAISLAASYLVVAGTYKEKCLPNTYVNAIKVGGLTEEGAEAEILEQTEVKDLTLITHKGEEVTFKASDFHLRYTVPRGSLNAALSENPYMWIGKVFTDSEYQVNYNLLYDEEALRTLIDEYDWGDEESQNACIIREDDGSFSIQEETLGDKFDTQVLLRYLREHMSSGMSTFNLEDTGAYDNYRASIRSGDLEQELELYNNYARCVITYDFDDRKKVVAPDMIADWLMTQADGTVMLDAKGRPQFDVNAVTQWVAKMAAETDTVGKPRHFYATLDGWIDVPWNGDYSSTYGWEIDQTQTVIQLIGLMQDGQTVTVEPEYKRRGYCRKTDDIGKTYVEADISAQHFWVYKDGECVMDDDFVSGTETNSERRTPRGVCSILSKNRNVTLGTYAVQGYECPVSFWMPFNWLGCGFHDLSRGAYGGSIYMYNGSHGCLNLKYSVAKELFDTVETGMPVLVHD